LPGHGALEQVIEALVIAGKITVNFSGMMTAFRWGC
jgi:hypothetical protein